MNNNKKDQFKFTMSGLTSLYRETTDDGQVNIIYVPGI